MLGWVWIALTAWAVTVCALTMILRGDWAAAEGAVGIRSEAEQAEIHA